MKTTLVPGVSPNSGVNTTLFRTVKFAGRIFLAPFFRLGISGLQNLPRNSAFILLPKHQRWEDIPLLALAVPTPLYYVAKHELFSNPIASWFLKSLGGIPLNRKRPLESRRSFQAIIELLKNGEGVVVFPEGTYYKDRMGPGQVGMIRLILSHLKLPFIPVGIAYAGQGPRVKVNVVFGEPLYGESQFDARDFVDGIMQRIGALSGF